MVVHHGLGHFPHPQPMGYRNGSHHREWGLRGSREGGLSGRRGSGLNGCQGLGLNGCQEWHRNVVYPADCANCCGCGHGCGHGRGCGHGCQDELAVPHLH